MNEEKLSEIRKNIKKRNVILRDGTEVNALGQGTWYMGKNYTNRVEEIKALRLGIDLGMNLIDTAEMYGDGNSEKLVGEAIEGIRENVFLVSKVSPFNAGLSLIEKSCDKSLKRLKTDYLDLYLLHWRGNIPLDETIEGMEKLKQKGKILRWGVSNFDTDDMKELWNRKMGNNCVCNEVLYHLGSRGIEYDLLPWQEANNIPIIAYCPLAQGGLLKKSLLNNEILINIAKHHNVKTIQILLAWSIRNNNIISIPKASRIEHVLENAEASCIYLSEDELIKLDKVFLKPNKKVSLDIV